MLLGVSALKLSDEELPSAQCFLEALVFVSPVWKGTGSYEEEAVPKTIGTICRWFSCWMLFRAPQSGKPWPGCDTVGVWNTTLP